MLVLHCWPSVLRIFPKSFSQNGFGVFVRDGSIGMMGVPVNRMGVCVAIEISQFLRVCFEKVA